MAWQGMIASSKFSDRIKGWSSCVPMHQGSLEVSADNMVDMTNVTIPCDPTIYQESLCGVITYVDPMEKCMDMNVSNNLVITPVYVNSSDCYQDHSGQCSTHVDFMKKGNILDKSVIKFSIAISYIVFYIFRKKCCCG